jgi:hypothetical protein
MLSDKRSEKNKFTYTVIKYSFSRTEMSVFPSINMQTPKYETLKKTRYFSPLNYEWYHKNFATELRKEGNH